jgi:ketosteroid isomerase-like protein
MAGGRRVPQAQRMPAHSPEELHARIAAAFSAGDLDALAALYEPDALVIVPPEGRRATGRGEIRTAVKASGALGSQFSSEVVEKLESDGIALTHARWTAGELSGRGTVVSRRQPDGTWRIVLDNPMSPG